MQNFIEIFNDDYIASLKNQLIFSGLTNDEIYLFILHAKPLYLHITTGKYVRMAEEYGHMICLVFEGSVNINSVSYDGNKTLLKLLSNGRCSSIIYSIFDYGNTLLEITASEESDILLFSPESIFITEDALAPIQHKILVNMVASQRESAIILSEHLACVSKRTIKDKVISFLSFYRSREQADEFDIPFSRDELASYLAVDRSALSRTLGEMKRDGLIDFRKKHFVLNDDILKLISR